MKFTTFLKIFAICFCSLIGTFALGYGIMYLTGAFNEPEILPTSIEFEQVEYNVDGDFTIKVTTTTADVTIKDLELSFVTDGQFEEKDGRLSDGVISIPKNAKIGEEISVILEKTDNEINGEAWITGGHSKIRARSINLNKNEYNTECNSASTNVNVDVPVYSVEVITKVGSADADSNKFVVNSQFNASLKFTPERSAYQFSFDGTKGYETKLKNTYFTLQSNNDTYISQEGTSNVFNALDVGANSTIIGYCFKSTILENKFLELHQDKDEVALRSTILEELKNGSNKSKEERTAETNSKTVEIVAVTVDSIEVNGEFNNIYVNQEHTLYANKLVETGATNMSNLAVKLFSQVDTSVSLQSQLGNVGIRFLVQNGEDYYDAVNNPEYKYISLEENFYSQTIEIEEDGQTIIYYFPVITENIDNYHWKFAVNKEYDKSLFVEVSYFSQGVMVCEPVLKSFEPRKIISESISWNLSQSQRNIELKIDDNQDDGLIVYEEYDLKTVIQIPERNQYKTTRFFAYTTTALQNGRTIDELIYVQPAKVYTIDGEDYSLYELTDGVVKAKTVDAHGVSFNVLFVTVKTNYKGELQYTDEAKTLYDIDQYSKDVTTLDNSISSIRFTITKTLKNLISHLEYNGTNDDFIYNSIDNSFAFVQGTINPFDVVVSYGTTYNEEEDAIFKAAIESGDISIVVKTNDVVTDLIKTSTTISDITEERAFSRFTMTVGSLPVGNTFINLNLYIRYFKTTETYIDIPVTLEFPDLNEYIYGKLNPEEPDDGTAGEGGIIEQNEQTEEIPSYKADFIEVYDGAAEVFKFNINHLLEQEGKEVTSQKNVISVTSDINAKGEGLTSYAASISTKYSLVDGVIEAGLFVEKDGEQTSDVAIVLQDKYGKIPLSSKYQLESSDTAIMVVSGDSFTFSNNGAVQLKLINLSTNEVEDILYFESKSAGAISKVTTLKETVSNYTSYKKSETIYNIDTANGNYLFDTINISVYGYNASVINIKSLEKTSNDQSQEIFVSNLLDYTYRYQVTGDFDFDADTPETTETREVSLIDLMKYEFVNPSDKDDLAGLIDDAGLDIETATKMTFVKDFGERKTIQLRAYVTELGISQYVNLIIEPNVKISVNQPSSQNAQSWAGVPFYTGVFAETKYTLTVSVEYTVIEKDQRDNSVFAFYAYDGNQEVKIAGDSQLVKILTNDTTFKKDQDLTLWSFNVDIEFTSQQTSDGYQKLSLEFKKEKDYRTNYDASHTVYVYVNPNAKTSVSAENNTIYLTTTKQTTSVTTYGTYNIYGNVEGSTYPIIIQRKEGDSAININKVSFRVLTVNGASAMDYRVSTDAIAGNYILYCDKILTNTETLVIDVLYDNYSIGQVTLIVSPNIKVNTESKNWILYGEDGGEYYLKLVRGNTTTTIESLEASFTSDSTISLELFPKNTSYITTDPDSGVITVSESVKHRLYMYSENGETEENRFRIVAKLDNGCELTFNVMLLPTDVPFVTYPNIDGDIQDINLSDLLLITEDVNWLIENGYYYTITESVNKEDGGTPIAFTLDALATEYGIQLIPDATYRVDNEEYAYYYKNTDETVGKLSTKPTGEDTFVLLTANLWDIEPNSLKIPYLIKITKELSLNVFYPYDLTPVEATQAVDNTELKNSEATYVREYLSFDSNGQASIDLLQTQTQDIPNKSPTTLKRISIFKNTEEYLDSTARDEIRFEVTKVYVDSITGFMNISDVSRYAVFSTEQNSGKLTIYSNGSQKLRIEIKITAGDGLYAYYYVSVGEIPTNLQLKYSSNDLVDLVITANREYTDILPRYSLVQVIPEDNITNNLTNLLHYYSPNSNLQIDETTKTISTEPTTNNWFTKLVIYTKYGYLNAVNVNVESNYKVTAQNYSFESGYIIDKTNFVATKDSNPIADYSIVSIELIKDSADQFPYEKYFGIDSENMSIVLGSVTSNVTVTFNILFNLGKAEESEEDVIYSYNYTFTVLPVLNVANYNEEIISANNKYEISATDPQNITINLSDLFTYSGTEKEFDEWKSHIESNNIGGFEAAVISEVALKSEYKATISADGTISVQVPDVVSLTTVSFKVEYKNIFDESEYVIFTSYFVFTLNPVITVTLNYPQANTKQTTSFNSEYFFIGESDNKEKFNLSQKSILADLYRVVLSDESKATNIVVSAESLSGTTTITPDSTARDGEGTAQAKYDFATNFTFVINSGVEDIITFTIYYTIVDSNSTSNYFAITTYIVNIYSNISNVWNVNAINYNTQDQQNSSANNEVIYIGSKDDVIQKIKVELTMNLEDGFTFERDTYVQITNILGVAATAEKVLVYNGRIVTVDVYLESLSLKQSTDMINNYYNLSYNLVDADDNTITDEGKLTVSVTSIKTRISLYYSNEICDIYKMFNIVNVSDFGDNDTTAYPIKIDNRKYQIGIYYAERIIDAKFDVQEISLSTGESVSLLAQNDTIDLLNHRYLLKMKHISDNSEYVLKDIVDNEIEFSIGTVTGNSAGYLRVTPLTSRLEVGADEYVYDYIFLAMGAPNESVTVVLEFIISVGDTHKSTFFTFTISNDYKNLTKKNTDLTDNSEVNRNRILATSATMSDNIYVFATAGAAVIGEDFLFVEHTNEIEGAVSGNIIPYFTVSVDNEGQPYIQKRVQTDTNMDLVFMFKRTEFGNMNIDLTFRDEFGYTFVYYITLIASYNPIYNSGTVTIYEKDEIYVTDNTDTDSSNNLLRVKFEKADETFADINAKNDSVTISNVKFSFNTVTGVGINETTTAYSIDNSSNYINLKRESGSDARYIIEIGILPENYYSEGASEIKGTLAITFVYKGVSKVIELTLVVKQLYTIKTVDETVYVRDGVPFSLIDIVEVIDNETNIKVGEKSLSNEDTAYIKYSLKKGKSDTIYTIESVPTEDSSGFSVSLGIKAYNRNSGKYTTMALAEVGEKLESYTSLQELFGITSITNYDFRLVYWDSDGQIHDIMKSVTNGSVTTTEAYIIKSSENAGASNEIVFSGYYRSGDDTKTIVKYIVGTQDTVSVTENDETVTYKKSENPEEDRYILKIEASTIIKDQVLSIGLREIDNYTTSNVNIYFKNGTSGYKLLVVNCDSDEQRKISLCEAGIITSGKYTEFYTGQIGSTPIINGMTELDRAKLKDIRFESISIVDKEGTSTSTDTGNPYSLITSLTSLDKDANNQDKYDTINGVNIYYQTQYLTLKVDYGKIINTDEDSLDYVKSSVLSDLEVKVTLRYIAVNKTVAYGSSSVRYVTSVTKSGEDAIVTLADWAGETGNKPFTLFTGYSTATAYPTYTESLDVSDNAGDGGVLRFRINSTDSGTIANFASIHPITGLITLAEGFDFSNNYLAIDVGVKYNDTSTKYVDTVKIAIYQPEVAEVQQNYKTLVVSKSTNGELTTYVMNASDVYNLITIVDTNGNEWTGADIPIFANVKNFSLTLNETANILTNSGTFTFSSTGDLNIEIGYSYTYYDTEAEEERTISGKLTGYTLTTSRYLANCINNNDITVFNFTSVDEEEILKEVLENITFSDIYNNENTIADTVFKKESKDNTSGYLYQIKEESVAVDTLAYNKTYTIVFKYVEEGVTSIELGSVNIATYNVENITQTQISLKKGSSTEIFNDYINATYYGYTSELIIDEYDNANTFNYVYIENTWNFKNLTSVKVAGESVNGEFIFEDTLIKIDITSLVSTSKLRDLEFIEIVGTTESNDTITGKVPLLKNETVIKIDGQPSKVLTASTIYDFIAQYYNVDESKLQVKISDGEGAVKTFTANEEGVWTLKIAETTTTTSMTIKIYQPLSQTDNTTAELVYFELTIAITE